MATLKKKPTDDQLREARKGGYKTSSPNKPKAGATLKQLNGYVDRYNNWVSRVHEGVKKYKRKEADKNTRKKLKEQIARR